MSSFGYDPEFLVAMTALIETIGVPEIPDAVSVESLRRQAEKDLPLFGELAEPQPHVSFERHVCRRDDGSELELRWYTARDSAPGSAAVFVHGGGMVLGDLDVYDRIVAQYVGRSGVPLLAVEYRLAPEHPYPAALDDCSMAVAWLHDHAAELGVDPTRIAIMGDSGGGAIAAATALVTRDRELPPLCAQLLIYPMLDDRTRTPDPVLAPWVGWTWENSVVAWDAVTGGVSEPSEYAAPARANSLAGLPRTYIDTGELDVFRAEILIYASRLTAAGVSTELHMYPGVPHAFELVAPKTSVARKALQLRFDFLRTL